MTSIVVLDGATGGQVMRCSPGCGRRDANAPNRRRKGELDGQEETQHSALGVRQAGAAMSVWRAMATPPESACVAEAIDDRPAVVVPAAEYGRVRMQRDVEIVEHSATRQRLDGALQQIDALASELAARDANVAMSGHYLRVIVSLLECIGDAQMSTHKQQAAVREARALAVEAGK